MVHIRQQHHLDLQLLKCSSVTELCVFQTSTQVTMRDVTILWTLSLLATLMTSLTVMSASNSLHVIVIDAGSTGTRLNYYIFQKDLKAPFKIMLKSLVQRETEPGLSAYADNPDGAYKSIVELVDDANVSPDGADLLVKATAGIRLLAKKDSDLAQRIMDSVYQHLKKKYNGTLRVWPGGVSVLSGIREGDFGWLALLFLSTTWNSTHSHGIMDLGGASTQITFEYNNFTALPPSVTNKEHIPKDYFSKLPAFGKEYNLYSHSYLGLGVNAARIISLNVSDYCLLQDCRTAPPYLTPCLHENFTDSVRSGPSAVRLKGTRVKKPADRYQLCLETMKKSVASVHRLGDKKKKFPTFVLRSGFYYFLTGTGLVPKSGGALKMENIKKKAKYLCENVLAVGKFAPYNCMNYCYMISLLRHGYRLAAGQTFRVLNQVNGYTPDWALGLAAKEAYAHMFDHSEEEEKIPQRK